jgi:hypothetical protein
MNLSNDYLKRRSTTTLNKIVEKLKERIKYIESIRGEVNKPLPRIQTMLRIEGDYMYYPPPKIRCKIPVIGDEVKIDLKSNVRHPYKTKAFVVFKVTYVSIKAQKFFGYMTPYRCQQSATGLNYIVNEPYVFYFSDVAGYV